MRISSLFSTAFSVLVAGIGLALLVTGCDGIVGSGDGAGSNRALVRIQNSTGESLSDVHFLLSREVNDPENGDAVDFSRIDMPDLDAGEISSAMEVELGERYLEVGVDATVESGSSILATVQTPTFAVDTYVLTVTASSEMQDRLRMTSHTKDAGGTQTDIRLVNQSDRAMSDVEVRIPKVYDGEGRPEVDTYSFDALQAGEISAYLEVPRTVESPEFEVSISSGTIAAGMLDTPYEADDFLADGQYTYELTVVQEEVYFGSASLEKE